MPAWNNWLHCCGSTYGQWLRGDPRGWRARHGREHVDGDYKAPPPKGKYDALHAQSRRLMKRDRVTLTPAQRAAACRVIVESLLYHKVEVLAVAVSAKHWHVLARFHELGSILTTDRTARRLMGIAKKNSARALSDAGMVKPGGVWAVRCRPLPVKSRAHQVKVFGYLRKHRAKGAVVWSVHPTDVRLLPLSPGIQIPGLGQVKRPRKRGE
ncbi:MAG: hypothetical protein AVDCRST_MAG64-1440 [uncultured Phycisphaerae bacterium]|uniref:Transposase IS200-like domain-containing protein n=1 Tax=uncultured Phycisphaerae bacterium TaxID=904963 RepID=A0A6J4NV23_9BACT|nr:MAG: hypothetical protein AVDCRST_MAG64-1440 [uncultured Phycisphaerae bacterium]